MLHLNQFIFTQNFSGYFNFEVAFNKLVPISRFTANNHIYYAIYIHLEKEMYAEPKAHYTKYRHYAKFSCMLDGKWMVHEF